MTRTTVNASTVLGANYEIITLEPNNYNPQIDDEITITCTVQDVYGDPVANKSVTLYQDGTSEGTETTDNTGAATWTITFSDWDVHHFNVANATIELSAKGCKITHPHEYYWIYEWEDKAGVKIHINTNINFPTSWTNINNVVIPHRLAPIYPVTELNVVTANTGVGVRESNDHQATEIIGKSLTGSQVSANCYVYLEWSKQ